MNKPGLNPSVIAVTAVLVLPLQPALADRIENRVEDRREWTETFEVSTPEPTLEIHNIWGDVRVVPGPEGEVSISIREHRSAPSRALFERSREIYGLDIQADEGAVLARVGQERQSWRGPNPCRGCRVNIRFDVRVPPGSRVYVSTVNDGRLEVSGILGEVSADNVNGPVTIDDARACESVESVNGDVSLSFLAAPGADCRIETVNGDIRVQVPEGSGLDFAVDLGNGRVTSELPVDPLAIPARVEHRESAAGHQYRIEQAAGIRLADGGPVFSVKSLNGDLRIQKTH